MKNKFIWVVFLKKIVKLKCILRARRGGAELYTCNNFYGESDTVLFFILFYFEKIDVIAPKTKIKIKND